MVEDIKKIEIVPDFKVVLYAKTAQYIFLQCFEKAGIIVSNTGEPEKFWARKLRVKLADEMPLYRGFGSTWGDYDMYLRDRYRKIEEYMRAGLPHKELVYANIKFYPLLTFAGIRDHDALNASLKLPAQPTPLAEAFLITEPLKINVVYTKRPFSLLNILRIPDAGQLSFQGNGDCTYNGASAIHLQKGLLKNIAAYTMPGDREPLWVRVNYTCNSVECSAFFAEAEMMGGALNLAAPDKLTGYFRQQLLR